MERVLATINVPYKEPLKTTLWLPLSTFQFYSSLIYVNWIQVSYKQRNNDSDNTAKSWISMNINWEFPRSQLCDTLKYTLSLKNV